MWCHGQLCPSTSHTHLSKHINSSSQVNESFYFFHGIINQLMMIKTMTFTHWPPVSLTWFTFCWWHHKWFLMMHMLKAISNTLDTNFIHENIHGLPCKKIFILSYKINQVHIPYTWEMCQYNQGDEYLCNIENEVSCFIVLKFCSYSHKETTILQNTIKASNVLLRNIHLNEMTPASWTQHHTRVVTIVWANGLWPSYIGH